MKENTNTPRNKKHSTVYRAAEKYKRWGGEGEGDR